MQRYTVRVDSSHTHTVLFYCIPPIWLLAPRIWTTRRGHSRAWRVGTFLHTILSAHDNHPDPRKAHETLHANRAGFIARPILRAKYPTRKKPLSCDLDEAARHGRNADRPATSARRNVIPAPASTPSPPPPSSTASPHRSPPRCRPPAASRRRSAPPLRATATSSSAAPCRPRPCRRCWPRRTACCRPFPSTTTRSRASPPASAPTTSATTTSSTRATRSASSRRTPLMPTAASCATSCAPSTRSATASTP